MTDAASAVISATSDDPIPRITAADEAAGSGSIVAENVAALKALFPSIVTDGRVDFDVLRQVLGDTVEDGEERYGLNWKGKREARAFALTPSMGTLRPAKDDSVDWDTTRNIMIEGDNLEVLKLLRRSYAKQVKLIYIDPPYNTGNDFVYPDDYRNSLAQYERLTGDRALDGTALSTNKDASGRFHTDWLNMIYPRLILAKELLQDDGAIVVSIDDVEVSHLRDMMDEVFGDENFIATIIWQKVFSPKNTAAYFSEDHDYLIAFARSKDVWTPNLLERSSENVARYTNPDQDPRGPWLSGALQARNYYSKGMYEVTSPSGAKYSNPKGTYWRFSIERFTEMDDDKRIWWGEHGGNVPRLKRFLSEVKSGVVPQTLWKFGEVGHTQEAKEELKKYVHFEKTENVLNSVKPTRLLKKVLNIFTQPKSNDLVMDFFAGSGPLGHATMSLNAEDGGNRRFILAQIPERLPMPEPDAETIPDFIKSRLRAVGKEIPDTFDTGFRVYKLATSNMKPWNPDPDNLEASLLDAVDNVLPGRSEDDLLVELLLKTGIDLSMPSETRVIAGVNVYALGGGVLMVCLGDIAANAEALGDGMADWRAELAPPRATTFYFRDSGFASASAKANLAAILKQRVGKVEIAKLASL